MQTNDMEKNGEGAGESAVQRAWEEAASVLFPWIAAYLRNDLSSLYLCARRLAPAASRKRGTELDAPAAALDQNYYRVMRMVNNLSLSSYFSKSAPLPVRAGDVVETARGVCAKAEPLFKLRALSFSFACAKEKHICRFSRPALEELLCQLLSNAAKFTPSGGAVAVELRLENGRILLSVSDTGGGLSPEEPLFGRYLHPERMDPPPHGIGLGLSICRAIAEKHGGVLRAESAPGGGARFTLDIPDVQPEGPAALISDSQDRTGGFDPVLTALAESLPSSAFSMRKRQ